MKSGTTNWHDAIFRKFAVWKQINLLNRPGNGSFGGFTGGAAKSCNSIDVQIRQNKQKSRNDESVYYNVLRFVDNLTSFVWQFFFVRCMFSLYLNYV